MRVEFEPAAAPSMDGGASYACADARCDAQSDDATGAPLTPLPGEPASLPPVDSRPGRALLVLDLARDAWPVIAHTDELARVTGFASAELLERTWPPLWSPDTDAAAVETLARALVSGASAHVDIRTRRRSEPPVDSTVTVLPGRGPAGPIAVLAIEPQRAAQERLAYGDPLTGLPNRALLERDLDLAILRAVRTRHSIAVLFCDLNRFKPVNDQLGHAAGDVVLREVARRLRATVRAHDLVSRYGGDEFVIVLTDLGGDVEARAAIVAASVRAVVSRPIDVDGTRRTVGVSVGVSVFPRDAEDAGGLLATADRAMYRDKRADRPRATRDARITREALLDRARSAHKHAEGLRAAAEATIQDVRETVSASEARRRFDRDAPAPHAGD